MEHEDVHDVVEVALYASAIAAGRLIGPLYTACVPVCPVEVVHVLGESEGMGDVIRDHRPDLVAEEVRRLDHLTVQVRPVESAVSEVDGQSVDATGVGHELVAVSAVQKGALYLVVSAPVDPVHESENSQYNLHKP